MEWGLPESDIDCGNLAYIRKDFMQSLKEFLPKNLQTDISEKSSLSSLITSAEEKVSSISSTSFTEREQEPEL